MRKSSVRETLGQSNQEIQSFLNSLRTFWRRSQVQRQITHHLEDIQGRNERDWGYPGALQDILFTASYRHTHYKQSLSIKCVCVDCHSGQDPVCELVLKSDCQQLGCAGLSIQRR